MSSFNYVAAANLINRALAPLLDNGRQIERIELVVSVDSPLTRWRTIKTPYGMLRVRGNPHSPKGVAYLIEDPGLPGRGFAWVRTATIKK